MNCNVDREFKVYCASGWFTSRTKEILDNLESKLTDCHNVNLYSPRRDGIMLTPNQKHDPALRESIFKDNIENIVSSDFVLANIDCGDDHNDPGTIYEVGYAMANNIPVIGFALDTSGMFSRFGSVLDGFQCILTSYEELDHFLESEMFTIIEPKSNKLESRVLLVGSGDKEVDKKIAAYISESGANLRWLENLHPNIYPRIDEIFENVHYMLAVIDDRKPFVSWMIGQAYARNIPIVTYSNYNYGINIMLLISVLTHLKGDQELIQFLQKVKRTGLESIPPFDNSDILAM